MASWVQCKCCGSQMWLPPGSRGSCCRCGVRMDDGLLPSPPDPKFSRLHRRIRCWAKDWVKGRTPPARSPHMASFGAGAAAMLPRQPQPSYPSVHGNKRALLVGIAYRSKRYELKGTGKDVRLMKNLLMTKFQFPEECILMLTEEETDPSRIPTRKNLTAAMRWLVEGCRPRDSLFFHFSGHGSQRMDINGDEKDGYDETLCPLDFEVNGTISDDEIHATIVKPIPRDVKLHAVIDACHSGSSLDLPYVCRLHRNGAWQWEALATKGTRGGTAICFSGCDDDQTSSDTSAFTGDMTGALTYCFIQAVESETDVTYGRILQSMRFAIHECNTGIRTGGPIAFILGKMFHTRLTQVPQLSSSTMFDVFQHPLKL